MGRWSGGLKRPIADDGGSRFPVLQDADVKNSTEFVSSMLIFFILFIFLNCGTILYTISMIERGKIHSFLVCRLGLIVKFGSISRHRQWGSFQNSRVMQASLRELELWRGDFKHTTFTSTDFETTLFTS